MPDCCPPGRGCNAPSGDEACVLTLCSVDTREPDAALALARWEELQRVPDDDRTARRFHRRAFERARDQALRALAMRVKPWMLSRGSTAATASAHVRERPKRRRRLTRRASA